MGWFKSIACFVLRQNAILFHILQLSVLFGGNRLCFSEDGMYQLWDSMPHTVFSQPCLILMEKTVYYFSSYYTLQLTLSIKSVSYTIKKNRRTPYVLFLCKFLCKSQNINKAANKCFYMCILPFLQAFKAI